MEYVRRSHVGGEKKLHGFPLGKKFHCHANIFFIVYSSNVSAAHILNENSLFNGTASSDGRGGGEK